MLQEKRMEYTYQEIAIFKRKLKKRFISLGCITFLSTFCVKLVIVNDFSLFCSRPWLKKQSEWNLIQNPKTRYISSCLYFLCAQGVLSYFSFFTCFLSFCKQQVVELQEHYNSQKLLTAELSDKLERTEVLPRFGLSSYIPSVSYLICTSYFSAL